MVVKPILRLLLILCTFPCAAQSPSDTTAAAPPDDLHAGWFRRVPQAVVGDFAGQLVVTICLDSSGQVLSADIKEEVGLPQPYTKIIKDEARQLVKQVRLEAPPIPASTALRDSLLAIITRSKLRRSALLKRCADVEFKYGGKGLSNPLFNFAHNTRIGCLRYCPDGFMLATSGSEGRSIKLWDTQTGRLLQTLSDPGAGGVLFRFSPDGRRLAALYADGNMQLWKIIKGAAGKSSRLEFEFGEGHHFAFSPDSRLLAYNLKQSIEILDLETWETVHVLHFDETNYDRRIAWHPDGRLLAIGLEDRIVVRDIANGQVLHEYPDSYGKWGYIRANIFFSGDGSLLYNVTERDGFVEAYSLATDSIFKRFQLLAEGEWAYSLPDVKREQIGFSSESGQLQVFDLKEGKLLRQFPNEGKTRQLLFDFHPDGSQLARDYQDFGFQLLDVTSGKTTAVVEGADAGVLDLAFSPDRPLLAVANRDGTVAIWNTDSIFIERVIEAHQGWVTSLCFSPDGATLATGSRDSTAKLWDVETGRLLHQFAQNKSYVNKVAFAPDGNYLATGGQDRTIWLHALGDQKFQSQLLSTEKQSVYGLAFSPDGRWLASSCIGHEVKLWKLPGKKKPKILDRQADWSMTLNFSGDGKYLVYGKGRKLIVWDMEKETPVDTINSHESIVTDAIWTRGKKGWSVLSVGLDDKMNSWGLKKRDEEEMLSHRHTGGASAVAADPGLKWLASGDGDNYVYLENVADPEKCWTLACLGTSGKWVARQRWFSGVFHSSLNMLEHLHYFKHEILPDGSRQYFLVQYSE